MPSARIKLPTNASGGIAISTNLEWGYICPEWLPEASDMTKGPIISNVAATSPLWFWSDEWQEIEAEADEEIASGKMPQPMSFAELKERLDQIKDEEEAR